ncbi:splicing factor [Blastocladiella emersonii ATCC 22665]|nr:splicing factor [Blastocladiella emersonii ATCC 22665]
MADFMRKMIQEMMGEEALDGRTHTSISFDNPRVCRGHLEGVCLHELFFNTKLDRGDCTKIHSAKLKAEYEAAKEQGKDVSFIEHELERELAVLVADCDRRIRNANERVAQDVAPPRMGQLQDEIARLEKIIHDMATESEKLGEEGEVERAMELTDKIDEVKKEKADKETELRSMTMLETSSNQRMRVCEICGAFLAATDEDRRIADHFVGKMHVGYDKVRTVLNALRTRLRGYRGGAPAPRGISGSRDGGDRAPADRSSSYRRRSRSRSRSRDRWNSGGGGPRRGGYDDRDRYGYGGGGGRGDYRDRGDRYGYDRYSYGGGRDRDRDRGGRGGDYRYGGGGDSRGGSYRGRDRSRSRSPPARGSSTRSVSRSISPPRSTTSSNPGTGSGPRSSALGSAPEGARLPAPSAAASAASLSAASSAVPGSSTAPLALAPARGNNDDDDADKEEGEL